MRLLFSKDWLRRTLEQCEPEDLDPPCDANGIMTCSPEIYSEIMKMTTQVKIEITQANMPVVVEVVRSDGTISHVAHLHSLGEDVREGDMTNFIALSTEPSILEQQYANYFKTTAPHHESEDIDSLEQPSPLLTVPTITTYGVVCEIAER